MKKYALIIFIFVISIMFSVPVYAQTAKEAVMGLKKLQARVQSGISYRDYSNAVADAKFPVNLYMESADAKKYTELTESMNKAMEHYEFAGVVWQDAFSNTAMRGSLTRPVENAIVKLYPQADKEIKDGGARSKDYGLNFLLKEAVFMIVWAEASKELGNTTRLLAKTEENSSSELSNLKNENSDLKIKIAELQKENAALKAKQKKR
jgi:hypothetical protein